MEKAKTSSWPLSIHLWPVLRATFRGHRSEYISLLFPKQDFDYVLTISTKQPKSSKCFGTHSEDVIALEKTVDTAEKAESPYSHLKFVPIETSYFVHYMTQPLTIALLTSTIHTFNYLKFKINRNRLQKHSKTCQIDIKLQKLWDPIIQESGNQNGLYNCADGMYTASCTRGYSCMVYSLPPAVSDNGTNFVSCDTNVLPALRLAGQPPVSSTLLHLLYPM